MKPLKVEGLCHVHNGHQLLTNINFELRPHQVTGIIADNKERLELLLSLICGGIGEDSGTISIRGAQVAARERLKRVGFARETGTLIEKMTVLDNIFLSCEKCFTRFGFLNKRLMKKKGKEILKRIEALVPLDQFVGRLDPGLLAMVDIARVLAMSPDCYVFDEVTRGMSLRQYDRFVGLVRELLNDGRGVLLVPVNTEDIRNLVDRLYFLKNDQLFEIENCKGLPEEDLNDFLLSPGKKHFKGANDPIQKAQELLDAAVCESEIDFHRVADSVAMSYDNFRRRFKLKVGASPHQYYLQMKMERAKELLLYTDTDIKDIATQLGFPDPYYFSRVFKEREGVAPGIFRGAPQSGLLFPNPGTRKNPKKSY